MMMRMGEKCQRGTLGRIPTLATAAGSPVWATTWLDQVFPRSFPMTPPPIHIIPIAGALVNYLHES